MLNKVTLQGRFASAPEKKLTPDGKLFCQFTIASVRNDKAETTDFIPCFAFGKTATYIINKFNRSDMVVIDGRLQSRNYTTSEGAKRVAYEVFVIETHLCNSGLKPTAHCQTVSDSFADDYASIDWDSIPNKPEVY